MTHARYAVNEEVKELLGEFLGVLALDGEEESHSSDHSPEGVIRKQLEAHPGGGTSGHASLMLYARSFDPSDRAAVVEAITRVEDLLRSLSQSTCTLDVVLLLDELLGQHDSDDGSATAETLRFLDGVISDSSCLNIRTWLLDGRAEDGQTYSLEQVAGLLRTYTPEDFGAALPAGTGNYYSFGGRALVFPRGKIVDYVVARYALRVLDHEAWLDEEVAIPSTKIAVECADFLEAEVIPALDRIDKDESGDVVSLQPDMPRVSPETPVDNALAAFKEATDRQTEELEAVTVRIDENYETAVASISRALAAKVQGFTNDSRWRTKMARVFLEFLESGRSDLATGQRFSSGRPTTLREAFARSLSYLDRVTDFDSSKREELSRLGEDLGTKRSWLKTMRDDLATAEERAAGGDERAATETGVLKEQIETAEREVEELHSKVDGLQQEVTTQDYHIGGSSLRALERSVEATTQAEIEESVQAVRKAKRAADSALEDYRKAEEEASSALMSLAVRAVAALIAVVGMGVAGALLMPMVFGAVPVVGAPLFGFIGTAATATWVQVYGIIGTVAFLAYLIKLALDYSRIRSAVQEKEDAYDAAKSAYLRALRQCWDAHVAGLLSPTELRKHAHVLGVERQMRRQFDDLEELLESFEDKLRGLRQMYQDEVDGFSLESSITEFVVVSGDYADRLVEENSELLDRLAPKYFREHPMGDYLDEFADSGQVSSMRGDMTNECHEEIGHSLGSKDVLEMADKDPESMQLLTRAAVELPALYLLRPNGGHSSFFMVLSPETKKAGRIFERMTPRPIVRESDDPERLVVLKIVHDIPLNTGLAEK